MAGAGQRSSPDLLLEQAQEALAQGRWQDALRGYEDALRVGESGAALLGSAVARWWLREPVEALALEERAYAAFRRIGDHEQAVNATVYLCLGHSMTFGSSSVARGWLERGARIVEDEQLRHLRGWMLLCRAVLEHDDGDLVAAEKWAREASSASWGAGDRDLEVCARCELGAALVEQGRGEEGAALLDEAMTSALGGDVQLLDCVVLVCCRTIVACSRTADLRRATQWIRASEAFDRRYGSAHLHTTCRTHHGHLLFLVGRWAEAQEELSIALAVGSHAEPALHAAARACLAELRLAQGRLEDAERLLEEYDAHPETLVAWSGVLVARGDAGPAAALLRRRLGTDPAPLRRVRLLGRLVEAEIADGRPGAAIAEGRELLALAGGLDVPWVSARAHDGLGRALLAAGDPAAAGHLDRAFTAYSDLGLPYDAARCRLALATAAADVAPGTTVLDARGALAVFEQLGADADADAAAALLRSLGVRAVRRGSNAVTALTGREKEVLALLGEGLSNPEMAERMFITPKTVEHHVSRVLAKLGLRRRGQAAAYAVRHLRED